MTLLATRGRGEVGERSSGPSSPSLEEERSASCRVRAGTIKWGSRAESVEDLPASVWSPSPSPLTLLVLSSGSES